MPNPAAKYTDEFRRETADFIISTGRPTAACCRELGFSPKTVDRCLTKGRLGISHKVFAVLNACALICLACPMALGTIP